MTDRPANRVISTHFETFSALCEAGCEIADAWPTETVTEPRQVVTPLRYRIEHASLREPLIEVLKTAVDATGNQLQGHPVPVPPYLVVTSRGPTCRGTLEDGRRLVLTVELFTVDRRPREYRFIDPSPSDCLEIQLRN